MQNQFNIQPITGVNRQLATQLRHHANNRQHNQAPNNGQPNQAYRIFMEQHSNSLAQIFSREHIENSASEIDNTSQNQLRLTCPISASLISRPVVINCGSNAPHVFDKTSINAWRNRSTSCPSCRQTFSNVNVHNESRDYIEQFQQEYTKSIFGAQSNATYNDLLTHRIEVGGLLSDLVANQLPNIRSVYTFMQLRNGTTFRYAKLPIFFPTFERGANPVKAIYELSNGGWEKLLLGSIYASLFSVVGTEVTLQLTDEQYRIIKNNLDKHSFQKSAIDTAKVFVEEARRLFPETSEEYKWLTDIITKLENCSSELKEKVEDALNDPIFQNALAKIRSAALIGFITPAISFAAFSLIESRANHNYDVIRHDLYDTSIQLSRSITRDVMPSNVNYDPITQSLNAHSHYTLTWWWHTELSVMYFFLASSIGLFQGNYDEAISACNKGLGKQSNNIFLQYHKSLAQIGNGQFNQAITTLTKLQKSPDFSNEATELIQYLRLLG